MKTSLQALAVFLITLTVYVISPVVSTADTIWSLYVSASMRNEGNTDLNEYADFIPPDDYRVKKIGGDKYSIFPIGAPLLAVPFVFVADKVFPLSNSITFSEYLNQHPPDQTVFGVEKLIASLLTALAVTFIFLVASEFTTHPRAILTAGVFGFGTSAWSVGSRGLWQHGPSMLALSVALYIIVRAKEKPWLIQWLALPLVFAYVIRPTNIISAAALSIYVLLVHRRFVLPYLIRLAIFILPFFIYNYSVYQMPLPTHYLPQRLGGSPFFVQALAGNLVSPSRGLLIFSPILIFSISEFFRQQKDADWHILRGCLIAILILHWISISLFPHWYGGWSIGPRFFSDVLPFFIFLLIPAVDRFANLAHKPDFKTILFWALTLISLFIHFRCSTSYAPFNWNSIPVNIDRSPHRLWDWSDIQFLRGLCTEPEVEAPKCWIKSNPENTREESQLRNWDSSVPAYIVRSHIRNVIVQ